MPSPLGFLIKEQKMPLKWPIFLPIKCLPIIPKKKLLVCQYWVYQNATNIYSISKYYYIFSLYPLGLLVHCTELFLKNNNSESTKWTVILTR
jgi:hypothetical protein